MNKVVKAILYEKLQNNLSVLGSSIDKISEDTDLLKTGVIDSMEFVELLASISKETSTNIETILEEEEELIISINWFDSKFSN